MTTENTKKSIGEMSAETLKLHAFLSEQKPGTTLSYAAIEHETGVTMTNEGKMRLRSAANSLKIEFSTVRGYGIELADEHTATGIVSARFRRIDGAIRKTKKTHKRLASQFFEKMPPPEQNKMLFADAVLGALGLTAENARQLQAKQLPVPQSLTIQVPMLN